MHLTGFRALNQQLARLSRRVTRGYFHKDPLLTLLVGPLEHNGNCQFRTSRHASHSASQKRRCGHDSSPSRTAR